MHEKKAPARAMQDSDSFAETSFAVQWKTADYPDIWKYYSAFTPNPKSAQDAYENAKANPVSVDVRIVKRTDVRCAVDLEELLEAEPCSRKECRRLPTPNEGGRMHWSK